MICVICKTGTTHTGKTNTLFERDGSFVIVKDIPALVCSQCGEAYFDEKITGKLYSKVNDILNSGAELEVIRLQAA